VRPIGALLSALALLAFVAAPLRAEAAPPIYVHYAHVLRIFNPSLPEDYAERLSGLLIFESARQHLDPRFVLAVVAVESSWRPNAVSSAGAVGLGQLMPGTADRIGVDPADLVGNLRGTIYHLARLLYTYRGHDAQTQYVLALSAYNAGENAVAYYGGMPPYPETQAYVGRVLTIYQALAG